MFVSSFRDKKALPFLKDFISLVHLDVFMTEPDHQIHNLSIRTLLIKLDHYFISVFLSCC